MISWSGAMFRTYFFVLSSLSLSLFSQQKLVLTDFDFHQEMGVTEKMMETRIHHGLEAVGENGTVYLIQERPEPWLPHLNSSQLVRVFTKREGVKTYPWIRDSATAWSNLTGLLFPHSLHQEDPWLNMFTKMERLKFEVLDHAHVQGGNLVDNGDGVCLIQTQSGIPSNSPAWKELVQKVPCRVLVDIPLALSIHINGHLDLLAQFVGPSVLLIASIPRACKDSFEVSELKAVIERLRNTTEPLLAKQGISIESLPLAQCPRLIENVDRHAAPELSLLSYLNLLSFRDYLVIPEFQGSECTDSSCLDVSFSQVSAYIQGALQRARVNKEVLSFPVSLTQARLGGAARCLTLHRSTP